MGTLYHHLTASERTTLMAMQAEGQSLRATAAHLGRSPSTLSRELKRNRLPVALGVALGAPPAKSRES